MASARAVTVTGTGGIEVLSIRPVEVPEPGHGEIAVDVECAAVNRADILQRMGRYPAPPGARQDVLGLEYAGRIAEVGEGVTRWQVGAPVMGIVGGGAMCERIIVHEREAIPVPPGMSLTEAAAIPEVFLTAFDALSQAELAVGETVLVHAVGSGVGTAAVQLGRLWGARVIGTSRTPSKLERCERFGLSRGIVCESGNFAGEVKSMSDGHGADVIVDTVGAAYLEDNVRSLAVRGRLIVLGLLGGATAKISLGPLLAKRIRVIGSVLRSRPLEEKAALAQRFARQLLPWFHSADLVPVVDRCLEMSQVGQAHELLEANDCFGKIVLRWD